MFKRTFTIPSLIFAILAVIWSWKTPTKLEPPAPAPGRNNTVLFLTSDLAGLANVHVATAFALLENHPSIELHYASFPRLENKVKNVAAAAKVKNPSARPIVWHSLPGLDQDAAMLRFFGSYDGLLMPPGANSLGQKVKGLGALLTTWTAEEHWEIFKGLKDVIDEVDPAVVVFDHIFRPAVDLIGNVDRRFVSISPNALLDLIPEIQPWGGMFWKYPAMSAGFPFPIPWRLIPANIYMQLRIAYGVLTMPGISTMRTYLRERGIQNPLSYGMYPKRVPLLATTIPEANLPMDVIPSDITFCGPIVLDTAPAARQDSELVAWLQRGGTKTVLINLGTVFRYTEPQARIMAEVVATVLETRDDIQILWKYRTQEDVDDKVPDFLKKYVDQGRLKVQQWLKIDPMSLLQTESVDLFVHHGGGNAYHEAVLAGIPQVILPMWFDLYNFASTAEYLGIGVWPGKETAPQWDPEALASGIVSALIGKESAALRAKAQALGKIARSYEGRNLAAREIAAVAGLGEAR